MAGSLKGGFDYRSRIPALNTNKTAYAKSKIVGTHVTSIFEMNGPNHESFAVSAV
jgi:hypothetical protein